MARPADAIKGFLKVAHEQTDLVRQGVARFELTLLDGPDEVFAEMYTAQEISQVETQIEALLWDLARLAESYGSLRSGLRQRFDRVSKNASEV